MSTPVIRQAVAAASVSANAVCSLGAGTAAGDLLLIFHGNDFYTAAGMVAPTSSQTLNSKTLQATADPGTNQAHAKFWTAATTVGGAQTVTVNVVTDEEVFGHVIVIDGSTIDLASFLDGTPATNAVTVGSTSHVANAVSPTTSDALLVCFAQADGSTSAAISYTAPGGMTERTDVTDGSFSGSSTASQVLSASGTTGTRTFTASASRPYATISVAIKGGAGATANGGRVQQSRSPFPSQNPYGPGYPRMPGTRVKGAPPASTPTRPPYIGWGWGI